MLILKPNCKFCDKELMPESSDARICRYECTFYVSCVENILQNVCPNCGGGFCQRPIRPKRAHRDGVSRVDHPGSDNRAYTSYTEAEVRAFADGVKNIPPHRR